MVKGDGDRSQFCKLPARSVLTSKPFALDAGCTYRLTVDMSTVGALNGRICVEGYRWKPGVKPHAGEPKMEELQRIWRQSEFGVVSINIQWSTSSYITDESRGEAMVSKVVVERVE